MSHIYFHFSLHYSCGLAQQWTKLLRMDMEVIEKAASIEVREGEIETTDCTGEAVNTARAVDNSARAEEIAEEKASSALSVAVNARENARKDVQADRSDEDTQPEKQKKKRKRRKKKAQREGSLSATSAVSTAGDATFETTEQPNEAASTNQDQSEGKKSRRSKRKRKKCSQMSGETSEETSHALENITVNGDDLNASFLADDHEEDQKARGEDFVTASSAVPICDATRPSRDVTTLPESTEKLNDCTVKAQSCVHSEASGNQDQTEGKTAGKSRGRQQKNTQPSERTFEETSQAQDNMANGENLNASISMDDGKDEQEELLPTETVNRGKKKRNRRRKGNRDHEGRSLEVSGEGSRESVTQTPGSGQGQESRDTETPGSSHTTSNSRTNQKAPKSHERSATGDSPHKSRNRGNQRRPLYEKHWSQDKVSAGLKKGELVKGVVRISPRKYELAWVTVPGLKRDVLLDGMLRRNRALNGDVVALQILPRKQWKVMKEELDYNGITPNCKEENVKEVTERLNALNLSPANDLQSALTPSLPNAPGSASKDDHMDPDQVPEQFLQRTGKVVYIIEKKHTRVVSGHLKPFPHPKECPDGCFSPTDSRSPRIRIARKDCPPGFFERPRDFENTLLVARIVSWPESSSRDSFLAIGTIVRSLGEAGEIEPETEGILLEYGIDSGPFSDEVLACLPQEAPWKIPEEELMHRRDFREECVFTIDPLTARDLDDAVHCKKIKDGVFEVGVHIADVSYFVRPGTALDEVALERGTSTYMVQKVVPMLPRHLCEELCSLNPGEDRLTFSVVWQMSDKGEILSDWKGRGIIRSRVKMAYEHAQDMIDKPNRQWNLNDLPPISDGATVEQISIQVNQLHKFAVRLRRNRFENGALRLDQVKLRFDLDQETGLPNGYHTHQQRDANKLIEEFMLLANMAVARHIYTAYPEKALLRRHPKPHQKQLEDLIELCKSLGIRFNATSSKTIHESLAQFPLSSPEREVLVNLTMRPMKNAEYFCTGSVSEDEYGHFALSAPLYTHFTSPIRRYADLEVHRLLAASLGIDGPVNEAPEAIDSIAEHCNDRKLAAKRASELSDEMFFGIFVRESGPLEEDGIVLNVMDQSFDVLIPTLGLVKRAYLKFCPGVKSFAFAKGEKGKPAELRLLWSVKLKSADASYEEEQVLKIFHQVRVILTTESETETKSVNPFKVMAKLVPKLSCQNDYYIPSTPTAEKSLKKKAAGNSVVAGRPNTSDNVRKKLFDSEKDGSPGPVVVYDSKQENTKNFKAERTVSVDFDDVIVESEEETTNCTNVSESTNIAEDKSAGVQSKETSTLLNGNNEAPTVDEEGSDDVIVESESETEQY